jgi:hypothetical protein
VCESLARFEVKEVFPLSTRRKLVIAGTVLEGDVCKGMCAQIRLDAEAFWVLRIDAVEVIDRGLTSETLTGLVCDEQDAEAAELCKGLCPPGTVISVAEGSRLPPAGEATRRP